MLPCIELAPEAYCIGIYDIRLKALEFLMEKIIHSLCYAYILYSHLCI